MAAKKMGKVELVELKVEAVLIPLRGLPPGMLVSHIPEAVIENIWRKQSGEAELPTEKRKRQEQWEDALYKLDPERDGATEGFPAGGFLRAVVSACMRCTKIPGTKARTLFRPIPGADGLVPIRGEWVGTTMAARDGTKIVAANRPLYPEWEMDVPVEFDPTLVTLTELFTLFARAGSAIGIGAFRPEKNGYFGRFEIRK